MEQPLLVDRKPTSHIEGVGARGPGGLNGSERVGLELIHLPGGRSGGKEYPFLLLLASFLTEGRQKDGLASFFFPV